MSRVTFVGIDDNISEKEMSKMIEYLYVSSGLIRAGHIDVVWTRWLKPEEIHVDYVIKEFRRKIMERFSITTDCAKSGVSLPEDIVWDSEEEVYVVGTVSEIKGYIESFLRLDKSIHGEVCDTDEFTEPYIYQIMAERQSENHVVVQDIGFLFNNLS